MDSTFELEERLTTIPTTINSPTVLDVFLVSSSAAVTTGKGVYLPRKRMAGLTISQVQHLVVTGLLEQTSKKPIVKVVLETDFTSVCFIQMVPVVGTVSGIMGITRQATVSELRRLNLVAVGICRRVTHKADLFPHRLTRVAFGHRTTAPLESSDVNVGFIRFGAEDVSLTVRH